MKEVPEPGTYCWWDHNDWSPTPSEFPSPEMPVIIMSKVVTSGTYSGDLSKFVWAKTLNGMDHTIHISRLREMSPREMTRWEKRFMTTHLLGSD